MSLRFQCVKTVKKILEEKVFFKELKKDFNPPNLAFANKLILTAMRRKTAIDNLIQTLLNKKLKQKHKILEYILLLGATEILYLDTPAYAAINEYVALAKQNTDKFSSGMVNALLRKISLQKEKMTDSVELPASFMDILRQDYTTAQIQKIKETLLSEACLDLSFKSRKDAEKFAGEDHILFENASVRISQKNIKITDLEVYKEGKCWAQDLASSLPVCFLDNLEGKHVLDLCAAPGGKTAQLISRGAIVTALDINENRLTLLKENMTRLGFEKNCKVLCQDALDFLANTTETFDLILLDAPCSATGTFRRHPEILHIKNIDDVHLCRDMQRHFLDMAALRIKTGGRLLYCTCSIAKSEGEQQIDAFLARHKNFAQEPFKNQFMLSHAKKLDKNIIDKGVLRTLPYYIQDDGGMDAFFAACLVRNI